MTRLQAIQSNRAKKFARKVDSANQSAARASKVRAPEQRMDSTAPTLVVDEITGKEQVVRKPMDALGRTKVLTGKSHGTIATPSSYTKWVGAGMPAHPIYNRDAWKRERYQDGIALPTGGRPVEPANVRHAADCACRICVEFKRSIAERMPLLDPRIDPSTLVPPSVLVRTGTQRTIPVLVPPIQVRPR